VKYLNKHYSSSLTEIKSDVLILGKTTFIDLISDEQSSLKDSIEKRISNSSAFIPLEALANFAANTVIVVKDENDAFTPSKDLISYIKQSKAESLTIAIDSITDSNDGITQSVRKSIAAINQAFYLVEKQPLLVPLFN